MSSTKKESLPQESDILESKNINNVYPGSLPQAYHYPWRRYWVRMFDISLILTSYYLLIYMFSCRLDFYMFSYRLNYRIIEMNNFINGIGTVLIFPIYLLITEPIMFYLLFFYLIFFEPMMLFYFGTTPGKALLGIKIGDLYEKKISYITTMKRGFLVWLIGFGAGIPLISIFTMIAAWDRLTNKGTTIWDEKCRIKVIHDRLSIFRVILFITIFIVCSCVIGEFATID